MALTGTALLVLVCILGLASFVAVVRLWPRVAGRGWIPLTGRVGMLVCVNVSILLIVAVTMNDQYQFFADWTDLAGALGTTPTTLASQHGGSVADAASGGTGGVVNAAPALPPLPPGARRGDRRLVYHVKGALSGIDARVEVQLPATYQDHSNLATLYPVMETFAGYPGGPGSWMGAMDLPTNLADSVSAGTIADALIVVPQVEMPPGKDSECVNGAPGMPQMETWLTEDIPNWVMSTFRARPERAAWVAMGYSAGGWCAAMAAMLHPDRFGAGVVLGGYFTPLFSQNYRPYAARSQLAHRYDLLAMMRKTPPRVALWVETSHSDPLSYATTSTLLKTARSPMSVTSLVLTHAGHRLDLWRGLLPRVLSWLGASVPGFSPAQP